MRPLNPGEPDRAVTVLSPTNASGRLTPCESPRALQRQRPTRAPGTLHQRLRHGAWHLRQHAPVIKPRPRESTSPLRDGVVGGLHPERAIIEGRPAPSHPCFGPPTTPATPVTPLSPAPYTPVTAVAPMLRPRNPPVTVVAWPCTEPNRGRDDVVRPSDHPNRACDGVGRSSGVGDGGVTGAVPSSRCLAPASAPATRTPVMVPGTCDGSGGGRADACPDRRLRPPGRAPFNGRAKAPRAASDRAPSARAARPTAVRGQSACRTHHHGLRQGARHPSTTRVGARTSRINRARLPTLACRSLRQQPGSAGVPFGPRWGEPLSSEPAVHHPALAEVVQDGVRGVRAVRSCHTRSPERRLNATSIKVHAREMLHPAPRLARAHLNVERRARRWRRHR